MHFPGRRCCFVEEWNVPENCKLSATAIQNNDSTDPTELRTQHRLRLVEDHDTGVSELL